MTDYLARALEQARQEEDEKEKVPQVEEELRLSGWMARPVKKRRETGRRGTEARHSQMAAGEATAVDKRPERVREDGGDNRTEAREISEMAERFAGAAPAETAGTGFFRAVRRVLTIGTAVARLVQNGEAPTRAAWRRAVYRAELAGVSRGRPEEETSLSKALRPKDLGKLSGGQSGKVRTESGAVIDVPTEGGRLYGGGLAAREAGRREFYSAAAAAGRTSGAVGESLPLLGALRRADAGASFLQEQRRSLTVALPEPATGTPGWTIEELDRAVERDARRYDGGFSLY